MPADKPYGPEFGSWAVLKWLTRSSFDTAYIDPGKLRQNGSNESFNGKFWDELLSLEWFPDRINAKMTIKDWRRHYHGVRPHLSLGKKAPLEFKQELVQQRNS